MGDPVLHLIVGPNGAGKTSLFSFVLQPVMAGLPFVNADEIAAAHWPEDPEPHAYEASELAAKTRDQLIRERVSFVTETVFSHPSKLELIDRASSEGFLVTLYVVAVPEDLAVARVVERVRHGGHSVPEERIRARYRRLWTQVGEAIGMVQEASVYDNSRARTPFRIVARFRAGHLVGSPDWPAWIPAELRATG